MALIAELREVAANRGWPGWRTPAGDAPATVMTGFAELRGYRIAYEDAGSGDPIVLVPGLSMLAADWREMGYTQQLATFMRVITVDPLGHGRSDKPHEVEAYRWPDVVADLIAVMDAAGVERAPLWGYSRGAGLAALAAIRSPERVSALILGGYDLLGPFPPLPTPGDWVDCLLHGDWGPFLEDGMGGETSRAYAEATLDPRALGAAIMGGRTSGPGGVIDVGQIRARALVYCGGNDDPEDVRRTSDALGVPLHIFEGLDHEGCFKASEQALALVLTFLGNL